MRLKSKHFFIILVTIFLLLSILYSASNQNRPLTISNSERGLWNGHKNIRIEDELVIGKEYGSESEMFSYIRDIAIDLRDNLYVMDSMDLAIKVFNKDGEFIRAFGRKGQGPGEFQSMDGICWCELDNLVYIADRRNQRISWFSTEGQFLGSKKTTKYKATVEGINSLDDGRFVLTARVTGDREAKFKIIITSHDFEAVFAEIEDEFPIYSVGATISPRFSDVGAILGENIYYTSPSEYKIFILNSDFQKQITIEKSHPGMFEPNYVRGFYVDFNTIETLLSIEDGFLVGVQSTLVKEIPRFKEKRELIEFVYMPDLREGRHKTVYQLDFYNTDFQFLGNVKILEKRRLAGKDSQDRVYFIENEPFPRVVRSQIVLEAKT